MNTQPNGVACVKASAGRAAPSTTRPRMSEDLEEQLAEHDHAMAAMYSSMEDLSDRIDAVDKLIQDSGDAIPAEIDEDDSLVIRIATARR